MKKILLILVVLIFIFFSVSPVNAMYGDTKHKLNCERYDLPIQIIIIEPEETKIAVIYRHCILFTESWDENLWLDVTETTKIRFSGEDWGSATFQDLSTEGQKIAYTFVLIEDTGDRWLEGRATTITIYLD